MDKLKILYIAGEGRSGSTLIGNILGELPNAFCVGEIGFLWAQTRDHWRYCSCGKEIDHCNVWNSIFQDAFNSSKKDEIQAPPIHRFQGVLGILSRHSNRNTDPEVIAFFETLYRAVTRATGSNWIIDESKDPEHLVTLGQIPNAEIWVLHLVRDPRGVAYSWQRKKKLATTEGFMPRHSPRKTAFHWLKKNFVIEWMYKKSQHYRFLRYEDFVLNPHKEIEAIMAWMGIPGKAPFLNEQAAMIEHDHHLIASNPIGSSKGAISIRSDDEWKAKMSAWDKLIVTMITLPMLIKYRYL